METTNPQIQEIQWTPSTRDIKKTMKPHHSQYKIMKAIKKNKGTKMNITSEFSSETIWEDNGETSLKHWKEKTYLEFYTQQNVFQRQTWDKVAFRHIKSERIHHWHYKKY